MNLVGFDMTQHAAQVALAEAELSIKDIKVVELHDCFQRTRSSLLMPLACLLRVGHTSTCAMVKQRMGRERRWSTHLEG